MKKLIDYENEIGKKYGRLTIKEIIREKRKKAIAVCICECGKERRTQFTNLKIGKTKSCGCLSNENRHRTDNKGTHHLSNKQIYHVYTAMKMRCYYKNSSSYINYGGRGITVCEEWLGKEGFLNFYNWSMKNGYKEEYSASGRNLYSIDRIDNNKGYSPDNCRWVLRKIQDYNKRTNFFTLEEIERIEKLGFTGSTIKQRMLKYGYSLEEALEIPLHTYHMARKFPKRAKL